MRLIKVSNEYILDIQIYHTENCIVVYIVSVVKIIKIEFVLV